MPKKEKTKKAVVKSSSSKGGIKRAAVRNFPKPKGKNLVRRAKTTSVRVAERRQAAKQKTRPQRKTVPTAAGKKVSPSGSSGAMSPALQRDISTVMVAGASGCVGSFLVYHLCREGFSVVAADRETAAVPRGRGVSVIKAGDLGEQRFVSACMDGVDAVVYARDGSSADKGFKAQPRDTLREISVIHSAAQKRGVKRFIHVGSASIYKRMSKPVTEQDALEPRSEYDQVRLEEEKLLLWESVPGLPLVTILRAGTIYGPGCKTQIAPIATMPPLVKALGPYFVELSGGPKVNPVHGEDVARAAVFLLLHPKAFGEVFNVGDDEPLSFSECINLAMQSYGLKPLGPGIPYPPGTLFQSILPYVERDEIFSPLSRVSVLLWERMVRSRGLVSALTPRLDPETLLLGARDLCLDSGKIKGLGFRFKYPRFRDGWGKTADWYVKRKWIPAPEDV